MGGAHSAPRRVVGRVGPLNRYGWSKRQDGAIRQQLIEQLMRQIMHYDGEFRREETTSAVGSTAKHDGGLGRPEYGV